MSFYWQSTTNSTNNIQSLGKSYIKLYEESPKVTYYTWNKDSLCWSKIEPASKNQAFLKTDNEQNYYSGSAPNKKKVSWSDELNYSPTQANHHSSVFNNSIETKFINDALRAHNFYRSKHGAPSLSHNEDLSKKAQDYAINLASLNRLEHSSHKKLGENLAMFYDSRYDFYSGEKATQQWYEEAENHNYSMDYQPASGHFSQLIWKNTKEVGFGIAKASNGYWYAVANYYPAGNVIGSFRENVQRPQHNRN